MVLQDSPILLLNVSTISTHKCPYSRTTKESADSWERPGKRLGTTRRSSHEPTQPGCAMEQGAGCLVQAMLPPQMSAGAETAMETHFREEDEEEATFNHSRCKLGFQGLAQKLTPTSCKGLGPATAWGWRTPLVYEARTLRGLHCAPRKPL